MKIFIYMIRLEIRNIPSCLLEKKVCRGLVHLKTDGYSVFTSAIHRLKNTFKIFSNRTRKIRD